MMIWYLPRRLWKRFATWLYVKAAQWADIDWKAEAERTYLILLEEKKKEHSPEFIEWLLSDPKRTVVKGGTARYTAAQRERRSRRV